VSLMGRVSDYRLFWREFRSTFHTTGAVAPSGRWLARSLARHVRAGRQSGPGRRVLEVGPGTGAVTAHIVAALAPADQLDLCELNDRFAERLRERLASDPPFAQVAE